MHWSRAIALLASVSTVPGVAGVPLFAQSDSRATRADHAPVRIARHTTASVLRVYEGEQAPPHTTGTLPPNVTVPELLRPTMEAMLERSPTFRRQCQRIGAAPGLIVRLTRLQPGSASGPRASTRIVRGAGGRLTASVTIRGLDDVPELIAHELEHVIEQLDGVDLRTRSALAGKDVWSCADGSFETRRAVRIGREAARESAVR